MRGKKQKARTEEAAFQPEAVYFDTNALRRARWPKGSAELQQIMQHAKWLGARVCLPEVVRQELEGQWIRAVQKQWENTNSQIAALTGMLKPLREVGALANPPSRAELVEKFHQDSRVLMEKMALVPITERPVSDFVTMAVFRGAAFDENGRGFRDSVILCSILEHMVASKAAKGAFVSDDEDFQKSEVQEMVRASKVDLRILRTLDELQALLQKNKSAAVRRFLEQERKKLMEALNQRLPEVEKYISENLKLTLEDLRPIETLHSRVESLKVIGIENAHEGFFWPQEGPKEPDRVRISADVKIQLTLDIRGRALPESLGLKFGGGCVFTSRAAPQFRFNST